MSLPPALREFCFIETNKAVLERHIQVRIDQLAPRTYRCSLARVDAVHSNITAHWHEQDTWPTPEQWAQLHAADTLDEQPLPDVIAHNGTASFDFDLPMPGVARLRLTPQEK